MIVEVGWPLVWDGADGAEFRDLTGVQSKDLTCFVVLDVTGGLELPSSGVIENGIHA